MCSRANSAPATCGRSVDETLVRSSSSVSYCIRWAADSDFTGESCQEVLMLCSLVVA